MGIATGLRAAAILAAILTTAAILPVEAAAEPFPARIIETATGAEITEDALIAQLSAAELVILGEIHDNPLHHAIQARLVAQIAPGGLAFEHIPGKEEALVNGLLARGTAPIELGAQIGWDRLGWPDWAQFAPIIAAAPRGAYVAAGGVPRPELMAAMRDSAASVWGAGAADWGLTIQLEPAEIETLTEEMIIAHCGVLPPEIATGMIEAQRLRDARFGAALLRAQQKGLNGRAVLVTGNGHARLDRGAPLYLGVMAPDLTLVSVGIVEEGTDLTAAPYDYVIVTQAAERPDPCVEFRENYDKSGQ